MFNQSAKSAAHPVDIHQFAKAMGGKLLVSFSQHDENKHYKLSSGQCTGIVHYWLCMHMLNPILINANLNAVEQAKLEAMTDNYGDVMLMQRHYAAPLTTTTFSNKSYQSLQEIGVASLTKDNQNVSFVQALPQVEYSEGPSIHKEDAKFYLMNEIRTGLAQNKYLSFQYNWLDDASVVGFAEKYISHDGRHKHGHRVAMIENPCPGFELFFFDANLGVYAFPQKKNFFSWLSVYFDYKFRLNAELKSCACIYPVNLSPQKTLKDMFKIFESATDSVSSVFNAVQKSVNHAAEMGKDVFKKANS